MAYAILRTKKLKSMAALARSARHTFREQETTNADTAPAIPNPTIGRDGADQVIAAFEQGLPEKRRRDAVIAIEYLITASPEAFKRHGGHLGETWIGYFEDGLAWLRERHGHEHVVSATIHLDEMTPHLVVYVIPKTADGRLCARDFLGGPKVLRDLQNSFYDSCGVQHGLERGLSGSKAKHDDIKAFYAIVNSASTGEDNSDLDNARQALLAKRNLKALEARIKALHRAEAAFKEKELALELRLKDLEELERNSFEPVLTNENEIADKSCIF